ncbi:MAG: hypothetical protein R3B57_04695 [Phycisphaerales bacterium]
MEPIEEQGGAVGKERDVFGRTPKDRTDWSHRKGEPRVFALFWTAYLMAATLLMFASLSAAWVVSPESYRPAARMLLMVVSVGIVMLWPMTRLCQAAVVERPLWSTFKDMVVVLTPVQALVWPHALRMLAGWPVSVVAGVSCVTIAWGVVAGGVLAMAQVTRGGGRGGRGAVVRASWMRACVALVAGAPLWLGLTGALRVDAIDGAEASTTVGWMFSAPTAVAEVTRARVWTGHPAAIGGLHWMAIVWTLCVGGACWAGAWGLGLARRRASA